MENIERILLKLMVIQGICLLSTQLFFHKLNVFPELKEIVQYEGVADNNFSELLETIHLSE